MILNTLQLKRAVNVVLFFLLLSAVGMTKAFAQSFTVTDNRDLVANLASSTNILSIGNYTGAEGEILTIDINLANEDEVSGFQFDIPINEGFTYVNGSIVKSSRCSPNHIIIAQVISSGDLRVLCYTLQDTNISGNDGAIASLQILLGEEGTYDLSLENIVLSTRNGGVLPVISTGGTLTISGSHEYVDLGLPSGLLWATCNVGANAPEEYGDYFAWGETQPKDVYNWSTYQYCMGSYNTLTKYCTNPNYGYNGFTDTLTILLPEDDAATANWGDGWRMPTREEWHELYQNTTSTWTTQNGVNGRLFTAPNGNSLFLPAAGYRWDSYLYNVGAIGYGWSSLLRTDSPNGAYYFLSGSNGYGMNYEGIRDYGLCVRAVRSASPVLSYIITATANPAEGGTIEGAGSYAEGSTCTLTAAANAGYTFTNWTENGEVVSTEAEYSFTVTGDRTLVANFVEIGGDDNTYVDLGLPSGLLWATCNVGANASEDYGDYYAWGETQPKDVYTWSTYQYCMGSYNTLTKYCTDPSYGYNGFTDNLTTLLPEDDAATANWGDGWRMPTNEEWQELLNNTTVTWTQQNGVNGRLFTAPNGNSLFLPAAGRRWGGDLYDVGSRGLYWSSSLSTGNPYDAWFFYFDSDGYGMNYYYFNYRYGGQSVRAVRSALPVLSYIITATANPAEGGTVSGAGSYAEGTICTLTAAANAGYTFTNWTENGEVVSTEAEYSFTVTGDRNLVANFEEIGGDDHAYIDLGLPSGLLWATCNVGANAPEEYGDYFAWGETQPKDIYNWSTYQYCMGSDNTLTKYCTNPSYGYNGFTDNLTILLPEDDAATANWGNGWRMPTKEEWQELYQNTTNTWTTQNGVNGRLFTAPNGNSLFLPAAGFRWDDVGVVGSYCIYWSSSLRDNPNGAWSFDIYSGSYSRYNGLSVRAVRSASPVLSYIITATANPTEGGTIEGAGSYAEGSTCTLTATANAGYTFINWTENGEVVSTDATYSFVVTGNRDLVANFAPSTNILSIGDYTGAEGEILTVDINLANVDEVGAFQFDIPINEGFTYVEGSIAKGERCGPNHILISQIVSSGALRVLCYSPQHTNISGNDGAIASLQIFLGEEGTYDLSLENIALTTINGGELPVIGIGGTLTVTGGQTVTHTVTATVNPVGAGTVTGAGEYEEGETATLVATANSGFDFVNWTEDGTEVSTDATYSFVVTGNRDLVANFAPSTNILSIGDYTGAEGEILTIDINLANEDEVSGFQFDIPINEGFTYVEGSIAKGERCGPNFILISQIVSSGALRVLCYSMPGTNITGNDGTIASLQILLGEAGTYELGLENCVLQTITGGILPVIGLGGTLTISGSHEYIDLGLPSGLLWATCNVGANAPEEYGDYFAWGETQPKDVYNWDTYQYYDGSNVTKYTGSDGLTILLPEDDAATANWGNGWRMPTKEEWQELYQNTTVTWTQQNGVNGRLFTASNGNSLFLPAAGWRWDDALDYVGSYGVYWSSSLDTDNPDNAWYFYFRSYLFLMISNYRYCGLSVRAVRSASPVLSYIITTTANPAEGGTISGGGSYTEGSTCTLTATANAGYTFINWTENGEVVSTDATYSFVVTGNRDLVANFVESSGNMLILSNESGADGSTVTMSVDLVNVQDIAGFQVDIVMNEHISYVAGSAALTGRATPNHILIAQLINNGTILRLLCYSMPATNFVGNSGPVVTFDLVITGEAGVTYTVDLGFSVISTIQGQTPEVITIDGSVTIIPGEYYTITTTANPAEGGTVTGAGTFEEGTSVTVTATANDGYIFTKWTEGDDIVSTISTYSFTVTSNRALVANFVESSGNMLILSNESGADGSTVTMSVDLVNVQDIAGFQVDIVMNEHISYVAGSAALTGRATPNHILIAQLINNGTILRLLCYSMPATNFVGNSGPVVTFDLVITGEAGVTYTVDLGFSVISTIQGQTPEVITIDGSVTIIPGEYYTITTTANPAEGGTISGGGSYTEGSTCTLTATANTGYTFINWTENGEVVSTNAEYNFLVTEDRNLTANFMAVLTSLSDDFNDGVINPVFWTACGSNVYEEDGLVKLQQNVTDDYVALESAPLVVPLNNRIIIDREFLIHENYRYWNVGDRYFYGDVCIRINGSSDNYIGIHYYDDDWDNRHGTYMTIQLNGEVNETRICDAIFDTWLTEMIVIDMNENTLSYSRNDSLIATVVIPEVQMNYFTVKFGPYGWWTGHYHNMDYVSINTLTEDLIAYYPFDGDVNDYSGHGNHGTIIGNVVPATDRHGNPNGAYRFPGQAFNYISVPDAEILHLNTFTLSAWVFLDDEDFINHGHELVNKGRDISNGSYKLMLRGIGAQNEYSGINGAYVDDFPSIGQWHMVTGTIEGDQARFYIDGMLQSEATLSHPFNYNNTEPLTLGCHYYSGVPSYWAYTLLGVMDEVRIYNRALSPQEVLMLYGNNVFEITATANPAEGGTISGNGIYNYGDTCTLTATANTGYTFINWTENGEVVSTEAEYSFTVTGNRDLVANFTLPFSITASANPVEGGTITGTGEYDYNTTCTLTAIPNEDYIFVNWTNDENVVSTQASYSFVVTEDADYAAHFSLKLVGTVTTMYDPDPDDNQSPYVRVSWSRDSNMQENFESGNFNIHAWEFPDSYQWVITDYNPYEGNYCMRSNNGGAHSTASSVQTTMFIPWEGQMSFWSRISSEGSYDYGRFYIDGQEMGNWSGNGGWEQHTYDISAGEHTFKWAYTKDYSVNSNEDCFYVDNINFVSGARGARAVHHYEVYRSEHPENGSWELLADNVTDTTYVDTDWSTLAEGWYKYGVAAYYEGFDTIYPTYMARSNRILRAYPHTITATANPEEGGTITGAGDYVLYTECTLTATANENYTFVNWTENGEVVSTDATYSFTVTTDRDLVANFTLPFSITASANPVEGGTITGTGEYDYGTECTLTALPNEDYYFSRWTENGTEISRNSTYSFTVTTERDLVAHFVLKPVGMVTAQYDPDPDDNQSLYVKVYWNMDFNMRENFESGDFSQHDWETNWVISNNSYEGEYCMSSSNHSNYSSSYAQMTVNIPNDRQMSFWSRISSEGSYDYGRFYIDGQEMGNWSGNGGWEQHTYDISAGEHTFKWAYTKDYSVNSNEDCFYVDNINFVSGARGARAVHHYEVYRSEHPENGSWELLADNVTDTTYVDTDWSTLAEGWYKYGVAAYYEGFDTIYPTYMVRSNRILRAYPHTITATANPEEGGTITGAGDYVLYTECTLTALPNENYTFINWTENGEVVSTDATYSFTVTTDRDLVANFTLPFTIIATVEPAEGGTVSGAGEYDYNSTCTLTATANEGWSFYNWMENDEVVSTDAEYSFTVTGNRDLVANFIPTFNITATAEPAEGGIISGAGEYVYNTTCTLTAIPNEGYTFMYWMENGNQVSADAIYSFTVTDDRNLVANFALPFTITATAEPAEGGTVSGAGEYDYNSTCTLTAIPNEDYYFLKWTENGTEVSRNAMYSFTVTTERDLVANFAINPISQVVAEYYPDASNPASPNVRVQWNYVGDSVVHHFRIYRTKCDDSSPYILMTDEEHNNWFVDTTWSHIAGGNYKYGVSCVYDDGKEGGINWSIYNKNHDIPHEIRPSRNNYPVEGSSPGRAPYCIIPENTNLPIFRNQNTDCIIAQNGTDFGHFALNNPSEVTLYGFSIDEFTNGACFMYGMNGTYYFSTHNGIFGTINSESGLTVIATGRPFGQIEYNPVDGKLYGLSFGLGSDVTLYEVNPFDGSYTMIAIVPTSFVISFTITNEGRFILCDAGDDCIKEYDLATGELTPLIYVDWNINYGQDMAMDRETNEVYWAAYNASDWAVPLIKIDLSNNTLSIIGYFENQVAAFANATLLQGTPPVWSNCIEKVFLVSTVANPTEGGVVVGAGIYAEGDTCTLTAIPNEGYTFINWTENGEVVSTDAEYSFTVTGDRDLVANFALPFTISVSVVPEEGGTVTGAGEYAFGTECTLTATANEGYDFIYWTENGAMVSSNTTYSFTVTADRTLAAYFAENTQTISFSSEWTWISTYIEQEGIDGLAMLEEGLNPNGVMIKSQNDGFLFYDAGLWIGTLDAITNEKMYLVDVTAPSEVVMTGPIAHPTDHPITLNPNWTWIGYPSPFEMDVNDALANLNATEGDILKSQSSFSTYSMEYGWFGSLNTLTPGIGLMYQSHNSQAITLTYSVGMSRSMKANVTAENNHWVPNIHSYPNNMSIIAVVELDGEELQDERYELAVFSGDEFRGSARLVYVEAMHRYVAFLSVAGDEEAELYLALYDSATGDAYFNTKDYLNFESNAVLGSIHSPFVARFGSHTELDEFGDETVILYPNPVPAGHVFQLVLPTESKGARVSIINTFGSVISTTDLYDKPATLRAPDVPGVYMVRVVTGKQGIYCRKLIVN